MARKRKATKSGEVAESTRPQETTEATPADEAVTVPEMGSEIEDRSLPAHDLIETREVDEPGRPKAQATGDSPKFAKVVAGGPEYIGGPRPIMTVNLSGYSGGPSMHLLRSLQYKQLQIRFEQGQPDEQFLAMLKRAGWTDRAESEGVWTKQIDPDARWQSVDRMEQEFKAIANAIREERGLEPVLERLALA
jgi:hypothetical protein